MSSNSRRHGLRYTKQDNVFLWLERRDPPQTREAIGEGLNSPEVLDRYAHRLNPLLRDVPAPMQYYWVTAQSEYPTDLVFNGPQSLQDLLPRLLRDSALCFSTQDVMTFLSRKFRGKFEGVGSQAIGSSIG